MANGYNPIAVESAWYDWWHKEGFFKPVMGPDGKPKDGKPFVIPFPPPNVTGSLHIGHALTFALQDSMIRWYVCLCLPSQTSMPNAQFCIGIECLGERRCSFLDSIMRVSRPSPLSRSASMRPRSRHDMISDEKNSWSASGSGKPSAFDTTSSSQSNAHL